MFWRILDKDECAIEDLNDCDSNALCTNTVGSYVCRCLRGYEGDGKSCTGICLLLCFWVLLQSSLFLRSLNQPFHCLYGLISVAPTACSPTCDPNAFCQEDGGLPQCVCSFGYQGDGYNCSGLYEKDLLVFLITKGFLLS